MIRMRDTTLKALNGLALMCRWMAGGSLAILLAVIVTVVLARYLSISVPWADEIARLAFVWTIALGAAVGLHNKAHFALSLISERLPTTLRKNLDRGLAVSVIAILLVLLYALAHSMPVVLHSSMPATGISRIWVQVPLAVFAVLGILFMLGRALFPDIPKHDSQSV